MLSAGDSLTQRRSQQWVSLRVGFRDLGVMGFSEASASSRCGSRLDTLLTLVRLTSTHVVHGLLPCVCSRPLSNGSVMSCIVPCQITRLSAHPVNILVLLLTAT
jgi:hypothetical protein